MKYLNETMEFNINEEIVFTNNRNKAVAGIGRSEPTELGEEIVRRWNLCAEDSTYYWENIIKDIDEYEQMSITPKEVRIIATRIWEVLRYGE